MGKHYIRREFIVLVLAAVFVLAGGLCLAGKPGGGGKHNTSLSTVIEQPPVVESPECLPPNPPCGLFSDGLGAYINGQEGVRSLFLGDGAYGFTSDYQRSKVVRKVQIRLGDPAGLPDLSDPLPIHLAADWNVRDDPGLRNSMGGYFTYGDVVYRLRWGTADEFGGADGVSITKPEAGKWVIASTGAHKVRVVVYDPFQPALDLGLHALPFRLILTDLSASAQTSAALEDIFTWSPRGDQIAVAVRDGEGTHSIQLIGSGTGAVIGEYGRGLFASAPRGLAWANWREMLAFSARTPDGRETVFILDLANRDLLEIGQGSSPRWAPDDSRLLFVSGAEVNLFDIRRGSVSTIARTRRD